MKIITGGSENTSNALKGPKPLVAFTFLPSLARSTAAVEAGLEGAGRGRQGRGGRRGSEGRSKAHLLPASLCHAHPFL